MKRSIMHLGHVALILAGLAVANSGWAKDALVTVDVKVRIRTTSFYSYQTVGELQIWETDRKGRKLIRQIATIPLKWRTKSNGGYLYAKVDDVKVDLPEEGTVIARAVFTGKVAKHGGTFTDDSRPKLLDKEMAEENPKIRFNQLSIKAR